MQDGDTGQVMADYLNVDLISSGDIVNELSRRQVNQLALRRDVALVLTALGL